MHRQFLFSLKIKIYFKENEMLILCSNNDKYYYYSVAKAIATEKI